MRIITSPVKDFVRRKFGIVLIAGMVAGVSSRFLPPTPGIEDYVTILGAIAAVTGVGVAVVLRPTQPRVLVPIIVLALGIAVGGVLGFVCVVDGQPGRAAAYWLYLCTVLLFGPIGFLLEIAKLKLS